MCGPPYFFSSRTPLTNGDGTRGEQIKEQTVTEEANGGEQRKEREMKKQRMREETEGKRSQSVGLRRTKLKEEVRMEK